MIVNLKKSSTTQINKHTASGYSLFICCPFNTTKNKFDFHRGKECLKNFWTDLRKHTTKIISYEKKEMVPLTVDENQSYHEHNICYVWKKEFSTNDKKYCKVRDHWH